MTIGATITRLSIEPGTNQILFEGLSFSRIYWERDWDYVPNEKTEYVDIYQIESSGHTINDNLPPGSYVKHHGP